MDEASLRLREHGPNRIHEERRQPIALRLLREFTQFFSWVLWLAAILAFFLEHTIPGQGMDRLAYTIPGLKGR
jgi:sodium/potassium-transporting ATPase subunit alpha